jgi:predicted nucleotidyltransferase
MTGPTPQRDMTVLDLDELDSIVAGQPYPLIFATVSGAHLYGFPSRDSDIDLRGVHVLPAAEVVGLWHGPETVDRSWSERGAEIDLVTHDAQKFFRLLLRRNGYVLEQLLSPLVVSSSPEHGELVALAPACLTSHHAHHYRGFARTQWQLFSKTGEIKPLLYTFRTLLTGIYLMRSGEVQANLLALIGQVPEAPDYLGALVAAKAAGEHLGIGATAGIPPVSVLSDHVAALHAGLEAAQASSELPAESCAGPALHDLLLRLRLDGPRLSADSGHQDPSSEAGGAVGGAR